MTEAATQPIARNQSSKDLYKDMNDDYRSPAHASAKKVHVISNDMVSNT